MEGKSSPFEFDPHSPSSPIPGYGNLHDESSEMNSADSSELADEYTVEVEFRGEKMWYVENTRRVSVDWFWTREYRIVASTMSDWRHIGGSTSSVSVQERSAIIRRLIKYAREKQHIELQVDP